MSLFKSNKYILSTVAVASVLILSACGEQPQQQQGAMPVDVFAVKTENIPVISHLTG